jgi:hypothetical protein
MRYDSQTPSEEKNRLVHRSLAISRFLCLVAAVFPLLAILGWIFDIPVLRQVEPGLPVMHPNTAFGLLLLVTSTFLTGNQAQARKRAVTARAFAGAASLLGLLTLSEYFFGKNLGIDRFFFGQHPIPPELYPGRSSHQTALNLAIVSAALLIYNSRSLPVRAGQALGLLAGANALITLTGYIFSPSGFYGFPQLGTGMAIHTSGSFILLSIALLLSRPDEGIMALLTSGTRTSAIARRILLTAVLAPPLLGLLSRIGIVANWYGTTVQVSLFLVFLVGLLLRTTWQAAKQSEREEFELQRLETDQRFLADVGAVLGSSIDYAGTLENIARLAVRELADICVIDIVDEDAG